MIHDRPVGVVLTGGASEHMGVDKATMIVDGKPMAVHVGDALWEAGCHPVECQGGDAVAIRGYGLDVHPDSRPGHGPLPAIHDALERHPTSAVVVAACDLPDLDAGTIGALVEAGRRADDTDVAVATSDGERHLVAWWRPGLGERVGALLARDVRSFRAALTELTTLDVDVAQDRLVNLNTPGDVDARG